MLRCAADSFAHHSLMLFTYSAAEPSALAYIERGQ